jgi:serine protease
MNKKSFQKARKLIFLLVALVLTLGLLMPAGSTQALPQKVQPAERAVSVGLPTNQIIIKYWDGSVPADPGGNAQMTRLSNAASALPVGVTLSYLRSMSTATHVLLLSSSISLTTVQTICNQLMVLPEVEYAEPDRILRHADGNPSDIEYQLGSQWYFSGTYGINGPKAWDRTTGNSNIVIALLDTGMTIHEDINPARVVAGYDFIGNSDRANDGTGRDNVPLDPGDWITSNENLGIDSTNGLFAGCGEANSSWHGTHIAGVIGAWTNNAQGIAGVNWNSMLLPVRVLGKCGGYISDIADGMRWAAGLSVVDPSSINSNPAKVINLSLGGPGTCSRTEQSAINDVVAAGAVVVAAAGNDAVDASTFSPGNCSGVITVASIDAEGRRSSFSNYGSSVEISAPGGGNGKGDIYSTSNSGTTNSVGTTGIYQDKNGTSMAAAEVSGVVSLMFSKVYPNTITPSQVLRILQKTANSQFETVPKNFPGTDTPIPLCTTSDCGSGIVDADVAVGVAGLPDLVITRVTLNSLSPAPNTSFTANVTVKNQGGAGISGTFYTSVCIGGTGSSCVGGTPYTDSGITNLAAGASTTVPITITNGRANEFVTIYAYTDSTNTIGEGIENNNDYGAVNTFAPTSGWTTDFSYNAQGWRVEQHLRTIGDVNGDGCADAVGFGNDRVLVGLSNCSGGFSPMSQWTTDFSYNAQGWRVDKHPRVLADVNGDGKDDIVGFGYDRVLVALSNGYGFNPMTQWTGDYNYNAQEWRMELHPRMVADVNGDKCADAIGFGFDRVLVALSNCVNGFGPMQQWTTDFSYNAQGWRVEYNPRIVADVTGDGCADIVGFGFDRVLVAVSNCSNGFNPMTQWTTDFSYNAQEWRVEKHPRVLADVNGDKCADIIGFGYDRVLVALSNCSNGFYPMTQWTSEYNYNEQQWRIEYHPRMAGDVNGDGKADLIGFGFDLVRVALAK